MSRLAVVLGALAFAIAISSVAALPPPAFCDPDACCCLTGPLIVQNDKGVVSIRGLLHGQCEFYNQTEILCDLKGSVCTNPFYTISFASSTISIMTACGASATTASCYSGDCLSSSVSGYYLTQDPYSKTTECGPEILGLTHNAVSSCAESTSTYGICTATCRPGFVETSSVYLCNPLGVFEGEIECVPKDCGANPSNLPEGVISNCSGINTRFGGDKCAVSCAPGYDYVSGDMYMSCGVWGEWVSNLVCAPKSCGPTIPDLAQNVMALCSGRNVFNGDACVASCLPGYEPQSGNGVYVCDATGTWVGALTCKPRDCGATIPNLDPNAVSVVCQGNTKYGGSLCSTTCKDGYEVTAGNGVYECGVNGIWTGSLVCARRQCMPAPADVLQRGVEFTEACASMFSGDSCDLRCKSGFDFVGGETTLLCNNNGQYEQSIVCDPVDCPNTAEGFANAFSGLCPVNEFEDVCNLSCFEGYETETGSLSLPVSCGADLEWSSASSCSRKDCPWSTLNLSPNVGVVTRSCTRNLYQDSCLAACKPGFIPSRGYGFYTCTSAGTWSGSLECRPRLCDASIVNLDPNAEAICPSTSFGGESCFARCKYGFVPAYKTYEKYTCDINGRWAGNLKCVPIDCGSTIANLTQDASATCVGNTRNGGDSCLATCNTGFVPRSSGEYVCDKDGQWVGNLVCEPINCGSSIPGLDSSAQATCVGDTRYLGDMCVASCRDGFLPVAGSGRYTCNTDGKWVGNPLRCARISCGEDIFTLDPDAEAICEETEFEAVCRATCNTGTRYISGSGIYTCAANKTWIGELSCERVDCGSSIQDLDPNAVASCSGDTRYRGDKCTARCNPGYVGGSALYTCGPNAQWAGFLMCSPVDCGRTVPFVDFNAVNTCSGNTRYDGDDCSIKCKTGYEALLVVGENLVSTPAVTHECSTEGFWEGPDFRCRLYDCGSTIQGLDPNALPVNCSGNTKYGGNSCTTSCAPDYVQKGSGVFTCGGSGMWEGSLTCERADCGPEIAGLVGSAEATCSGDTKVFGDNCVASCRPGFLANSTEYACGIDGKWIGDIMCTPNDCGNMVQQADVSSSCSGDTTFGGDECIGTCAYGYRYIGGDGIFQCGPMSTWAGSLLCERIECPSVIAGKDPNANVVCEGFYLDSRCQATCRSGYEAASGTGVYTCGSNSAWSGSLVCAPKQCPAEGPVVDIYTNLVCEDSVFDGRGCTASCKPGYFTTDSTQFTCGEDGKWVGSVTCQPKDCGASIPGLDINAFHSPCALSTYGANCLASCKFGYVPMSGDGVYNCNEDGVWAGSLTCDRIDCGSTVPNLPSGAVGTCSGDTKFEGKDCTLSCDANYVQFGSSTFYCSPEGIWVGGCDFECLGNSSHLIGSNGYVYHNPGSSKSWVQAELDCNSRGGYLSSILSVQENRDVLSLATGERWTGAQFRPFEPQDTRGVYNFTGGISKTLEWSDGAVFRYRNWDMDEPDNGDKDENCVSMVENGKWADTKCDRELPYICKRELSNNTFDCVAEFELVGKSEGLGDSSSLRFSTAFAPSVQVFVKEFTSSTGFGTYVKQCETSCGIREDCAGFFFHIKTATNFVCYGLKSLGSLVRTSAISRSYKKIVDFQSTTRAPRIQDVSTTTTTTTTTTVFEYEYRRVHSGANAGGDGLRFSTVYTASAIIMRREFRVTVGNEVVGVESCQDLCDSIESCQGIYYTVGQNPVRVICKLLNNTGAVGVTTGEFGYSLVNVQRRVNMPVPPVYDGFQAVFTGKIPGGDGMRFPAAYTVSAILSSSATNVTSSVDATNAEKACFSQCRSTTRCLGVYYFTTTDQYRRFFCKLLLFLGTGGVSTDDPSYSYKKI